MLKLINVGKTYFSETLVTDIKYWTYLIFLKGEINAHIPNPL